MWISPAYAQAAEGAAPNAFIQLAPLIFIFVIFYFLLIRPQMTARKKHTEMVANVRRGDVVVTAGGIVGKVTKVLEKRDRQGRENDPQRRSHQAEARQRRLIIRGRRR